MAKKPIKKEVLPWLDDGLNVDALRYFLAAVELGSFQAAAHRLHVTPQAVGKAIRGLEQRLGPLILRDRRLRGLTPTGRALATQAQGLVSALSELASKVKVDKSKPSGPVVVGGNSSVAQYVMPPVCALLLQRYPRVQPHILALDPSILEARLLAGELDFTVTAIPPSHAGLKGSPGPKTPSVIVASSQDSGHWSDFQYVIPSTPEGIGKAIDGWPARGYPRRIAAETNQLEVAIRFAEAGVGAAVVPLVSVIDRLQRGSLYRVADTPLPILHQMWVTWRDGDRPSAAATALAEELAGWQTPDHGF